MNYKLNEDGLRVTYGNKWYVLDNIKKYDDRIVYYGTVIQAKDLTPTT